MTTDKKTLKIFDYGNFYAGTPVKAKKAIILECFEPFDMGGLLLLSKEEAKKLIESFDEDKLDLILCRLINEGLKFRYRKGFNLLTKLDDIDENYDIRKITGKEFICSISCYRKPIKECEITLIDSLT